MNLNAAFFMLTLALSAPALLSAAADYRFEEPGFDVVPVFEPDDFLNPDPAFESNNPRPSVSCVYTLPDGRVFIGTGDSRGYLWDPQSDVNPDGSGIIPDWFVDRRGRTAGEMGMVACTEGPDYAETGYFYVSYTVDLGDDERRIRVERFIADPDDLNRIIPEPEPVNPGEEGLIIFDIPDANFFSDYHFGGGITFGPDGNIFLSLGDDADVRTPQDLDSYRGKVLRMSPLGEPLPDNPHYDGEPYEANDFIYSLGFRNPFRTKFDPDTNRLYTSDTGQSLWEEINVISSDSNHGWPLVEGPLSDNLGATPPPNYFEPFYTYQHGETTFEGSSIVSFEKYDGTMFPASYAGNLFVTDWGNFFDGRGGKIFRLQLDEAGQVSDRSLFYTLPNFQYGMADLTELNDGSLLFVVTGNTRGNVRRITYRQPDAAPQVTITNEELSGPAPLLIDFQAEVIDEGTPQIDWAFGDGSTGEGSSPQKIYDSPGVYSATVTVTDEFGSQARDNVTVYAFRPLDTLTLSGRILNAHQDPPAPMEGAAISFYHQDGETPLTTDAGDPVMVESNELGAFEGVYTNIDLAGDFIVGRVNELQTLTFTIPATEANAAFNGDLYLSERAIRGTVRLSDSDGPPAGLDVWVYIQNNFGELIPYQIPGGIDLQPPNDPAGYFFGVYTTERGGFYFPIREGDENETFFLQTNLQQNGEGDAAYPDYVSVPQEAIFQNGLAEEDLLLQFISGGEGCDEGVPSSWYDPDFSVVQGIFNTHCIGCHAQVSPYAGLNLAEGFAYSSLVNRRSTEVESLFLVEQRNPGWSAIEDQYLFEKIACDAPSIGATMPPFGEKISGSELRDVAMWIRNGAKPGQTDVTIWASAEQVQGSAARIQFWGGAEADGAPFRFQWDFGDGASDEGMNVIHEFSAANGNEFHVTVSAFAGDDSLVGTESVTVTLQQSEEGEHWVIR